MVLLMSFNRKRSVYFWALIWKGPDQVPFLPPDPKFLIAWKNGERGEVFKWNTCVSVFYYKYLNALALPRENYIKPKFLGKFFFGITKRIPFRHKNLTQIRLLSEQWRWSQENEYHSQAGSTKLALNLGFHYARKAQLMSQMPDPSPKS